MKKSFLITEELFQKYEYEQIQEILKDLNLQIEDQFKEMRKIQRDNDNMFYDIQSNLAYIKTQIKEKIDFAKKIDKEFQNLQNFSLEIDNIKQQDIKNFERVVQNQELIYDNNFQEINDLYTFIDKTSQLIQQFDNHDIIKISENIQIIFCYYLQQKNQFKEELEELFELEKNDNQSKIFEKILHYFIEIPHLDQNSIKIIEFIYNTQNQNNVVDSAYNNISCDVKKGVDIYMKIILIDMYNKIKEHNINQEEFKKIIQFVQNLEQTNVAKNKTTNEKIEDLKDVINLKKKEFFYQNLDVLINLNDQKKFDFEIDIQKQLKLFLDTMNDNKTEKDLLLEYLIQKNKLYKEQKISASNMIKFKAICDLMIQYIQIKPQNIQLDLNYQNINFQEKDLLCLEQFLQNLQFYVFQSNIVRKVLQKFYRETSIKSNHDFQYLNFNNIFCKVIQNKDIALNKHLSLDSIVEQYSNFTVNQKLSNYFHLISFFPFEKINHIFIVVAAKLIQKILEKYRRFFVTIKKVNFFVYLIYVFLQSTFQNFYFLKLNVLKTQKRSNFFI